MLYFGLVIVVLVLSAVSVAMYFSNRSGLKKEHAEKIAELEPIRRMELSDVEKFHAAYRKKVPTGTPVYRVTGSVGYISIRTQGGESREYVIGGIRIASRSVTRLGKRDIGIRLDEYLPDTEGLNKALDELNIRVASNEISEDQVKEKAEELADRYCNHTIEFAFTKDDVSKAPAFITAVDDLRIL